MSLDIGAAVREGARRLTARNGLLLVGGFFVLGAASAVASQSLLVGSFEALVQVAESNVDGTGAADPAFTEEQVQQLRERARIQRQQSPLAVDVPPGVALGLVAVLAFVAEAVRIVAVRVFAAEPSTRLDGRLVRRNLPMAVLNGFVGGIVVVALSVAGLVALIVPGIFLYVSFLFLRQRVALADENFVDALVGSWRLARGNRFELFGLVVVLFALGIAASLPSLVVTSRSPVVGTSLNLLVTPVVAVLGTAITTRAYVQLAEEGPTDDPDPDPDSVGALGPDDIPEP